MGAEQSTLSSSCWGSFVGSGTANNWPKVTSLQAWMLNIFHDYIIDLAQPIVSAFVTSDAGMILRLVCKVRQSAPCPLPTTFEQSCISVQTQFDY